MSEFHVICGLPNVSLDISGVKFKPHHELAADGRRAVITEAPVAAETAALFKGIPGFSIVDADSVTPPAASAAPELPVVKMAAGDLGVGDAPSAPDAPPAPKKKPGPKPRAPKTDAPDADGKAEDAANGNGETDGNDTSSSEGAAG